MENEMSIHDVLRAIESLDVDDTVTVRDENGNEYTGTVVEIPRREDDQQRWLVKGDDTTEDHVLHVYYDIEGGPVSAAISFEDGSKLDIHYADA